MSHSAPSQRELAGQKAVVTGSSSGIGAAIARELAAAGCDLFVHARRNSDGAKAVAKAIAADFGVVAGVELCDLADASGHAEFVERAFRWSGSRGIDIWVNNAGADTLTGEAGKWPFEKKLEALWQVDVRATVSLSRLVGQRMHEQGRGVIINIGWDQAETGMAGDSGELFGTTKAAVMAFSRSLAKSLAPQVRVNCVAPGWIKTAWGETASQYWQDRARRESLLERWGTPEDIAHAVRFLSSPAASFITGHVLPVNGGLRGSGG